MNTIRFFAHRDGQPTVGLLGTVSDDHGLAGLVHRTEGGFLKIDETRPLTGAERLRFLELVAAQLRAQKES